MFKSLCLSPRISRIHLLQKRTFPLFGKYSYFTTRSLQQNRASPIFFHTESNKIVGTTILSVRKDNKVVVIGDGQVTYGATRLKGNAKKVRKLYNDSIIVGMAGATADAFTLIERLEQQLDEKSGQLMRACVELAKMWRTDKYLRRLEALLIVVDRNTSLTLTGSGEIIESEDGLMAIGSGGPFALAAARALIDVPGLSAEAIAQKAMTIAADICIYTNKNFLLETLDTTPTL